MAHDITDTTFETEVLARSDDHPVVIDLWAPWCGPCMTLGPILERVIDETEDVELFKVNVDENPRISQAFQVQSIPAVYAIKNRAVIDGFMGAVGEDQVREFVSRLNVPPSEADQLVEKGDEESLRHALVLDPGHAGAVTKLAQLLVTKGESEEALALIARIPETAETRRIAAEARLSTSPDASIASDAAAVDQRLTELLEVVKDNEEARQEFLDLLEAMDEGDEREVRFRKALTARLF